MTEALARTGQESSALGTIVITGEQVDLIKNTVAVGATDDELKLYFFECKRRGVHPLDRLIHFIKRQDKVSFQTSIDLFRSQAEETGEYRGQEDIEYGPMVDFAGIDRKVPEWAKATAKRYDPTTSEIVSVSAIAYWDEYYPGDKLGFQWRKMPRLMLGKCAEALALRNAFPRKLAGLYTFEEMVLSDLIDQGKSRSETKASTVKPGNGNNGKKDTSGLPPREALKKELADYCGPDQKAQGALLKECSKFPGDDGKDRWIGLDQLDKAKDGWIGSTLGKLRDYVKAHPKQASAEKKEETAGCPGYYAGCPNLSVHGDDPFCELKQAPCDKPIEE